MVGVKWLCRCDVFISQVASISTMKGEGDPSPPENNAIYL